MPKIHFRREKLKTKIISFFSCFLKKYCLFLQCQVRMKEELMSKIAKELYEFALMRYEELFLLVGGESPTCSRDAIEMAVMTRIVNEYEEQYFPTIN